MPKEADPKRLADKSTLHTIQVELQRGYNLSPVEAQVLAQRVEQLVDEQAGSARQLGQISYQAVALEEPAGKPLSQCRKVTVHLTLIAEEDIEVWASQGPEALRRLRVRRLVYEAQLQGGVLSQEDVAYLLGMSRKTIQRIFAYYRQEEQRLPSRGEIQDMGAGVSHKIPVIRKYLRDLSFSQISQHLGKHGLASMARYLRHFALVMILEDRRLSLAQMQSVIGISENLIQQYRTLYKELDVPEHQRTLARLKRTVFQPLLEQEEGTCQEAPAAAVAGREKRGSQ
jgi:AraC-like DNA-binding protein